MPPSRVGRSFRYPMSADSDDPAAKRHAAGGMADLSSAVSPLILVVEDNAAVRATVTLLLKTLQYRILEAENGNQALDILGKEAEIDLLFTDIVMPGGSGTALAARARQLRPDLKILFTSGFNDASMHGGPALTPADALLIKPYRRDALASKLREVLGRGRPPGAG